MKSPISIIIIGVFILLFSCCQSITANVWRLCEGGAYQHYRSFEKPYFNYTKKLSIEALHPRLRQTAVMGCFIVVRSEVKQFRSHTLLTLLILIAATLLICQKLEPLDLTQLGSQISRIRQLSSL